MSTINDLAARLLDLARHQAQEAEVYAVSSVETPVSFEANHLKSITTRDSWGLALRVIKNGRLGFAAGSGITALDDLVATAVETSQFGATAEFHMPGSAPTPEVAVVDHAVETVATDAMVAAGRGAIERVLAHTPGILCDASLRRRVSSVVILNTAGLRVGHAATGFSARISGTLVRGTDMLFVGDSKASCRLDLDLGDIIGETLHQLDLAKENAEAPHGRLPVVFTPGGFIQCFLHPLSMGLNGKTVLQGTSPLGQRLGQQVFDPAFTLVDDPTLPYRSGSRPFDDEGIPSRRLPLIDAGRVNAFVYDLQTAARAGTQSTGHGERALTSQPSPDLSVLTVAPGTATFDQMVAGIDDGLVVDELIGSDQGNTLGGDFGGNVLLGYRIQHGRITGRVKDVMVAGNVYELLKQIRAIGSEAKWVGGGVHVPPIAIDGVSVSSKG